MSEPGRPGPPGHPVGPFVVQAPTLGRAWAEALALVLEHGERASWEGTPILELAHVELLVDEPAPDDPVIARWAGAERLAWMAANFAEQRPVPELGGADSYASRLRDFAHQGLDQLAWVAERLRNEPDLRSGTLTTLQPGMDTTYIPCVSLLDFWAPEGAVELVVFAHSIDLAAKGSGNLVELARLHREVAAKAGLPQGRLVMHIKSAHVLERDLDWAEPMAKAARVEANQREAAQASPDDAQP